MNSFQQEVQMEENCLICYQAYRSFENRQFLPCSHSFHGYCLDHWLRINSSCPICRAVIPPFDGAHRDLPNGNIGGALPTTTRGIPFYLTANGAYPSSTTRVTPSQTAQTAFPTATYAISLSSADTVTPLLFQTGLTALPTWTNGSRVMPLFGTTTQTALPTSSNGTRVMPLFGTTTQTAQLFPTSVPPIFLANVQSALPTANSQTPLFSRTFLTARIPITSGTSVFSKTAPTAIAPGNSTTPLLSGTAPTALPTGLSENPKTSGTDLPYAKCETGVPVATAKSHLPGLSDINFFTALVVAFISITLAVEILDLVQNPATVLTVLLAACLLARFAIFVFPNL